MNRGMGDGDRDGDVDCDDLYLFADCIAGPQMTPAPSVLSDSIDCLAAFDMENDGDVDLSDFALFQVQFVP